MSEVLYKGIASALRIDADELIAKLKDDGGELLAEGEIAKQIGSLISERVTAARVEAKKQGQGEINTQIKKSLKKAGFELQPDRFGGDAIADFLAWQEENYAPPSGDPPTEATREELAKNPLVKQLILEARQSVGGEVERLKGEKATLEKGFEDYKRAVQKDKALDVAKSRMAEALKKGNIILRPEGTDIDPQARINTVFQVLSATKSIGLNEQGEPVFLNAEGELEKNQYGDTLPFDEVVLGIAKPLYGVSTQNPAFGGANPPANPGASGGGDGKWKPSFRIKDVDEYNSLLITETDAGKRAEISKTWQYQQQQAAGS